MFLIDTLIQNCKDKILENANNILLKLYETSFDMDGLLIQLATSAGREAALATLKTYALENMYALGAAALQKTLGVDINAAWELLQAALATFLSSFDDAVFHLLKRSAKTALETIEKKTILLDRMEHEFIIYYNILVSLTAGDPVYDEYLDRLRRAVIELDLSEKDFKLVLSEISRTKQVKGKPQAVGQFLGHVHERGERHFQQARELIVPNTNGDYVSKNWHNGKTSDSFNIDEDAVFGKAGVGTLNQFAMIGGATPAGANVIAGASIAEELSNPDSSMRRYSTNDTGIPMSVDEARNRLPKGIGSATPRAALRSTVNNGAFLLRNVGIPAGDDQIANWSALSSQAKRVVSSSAGYIETVLQININLYLFTSGLANLNNSIPNFLKNVTISTLNTVIAEVEGQKEDMAENLNGAKNYIDGPVDPTFKPAVFALSGMTSIWSAKMELISAYIDQVPTTALEILQLKNEQKAAFNQAVEALQDMDDIVTRNAYLPAENAQEKVGVMEAELAAFIAETHNALYTFSVDEEVLESGRALVERFSLIRGRDAEITRVLTEFIDFEKGADEKMEKMAEDLERYMAESGLSKMNMDWLSGDWMTFFGTGPNAASNIAMAMGMVSFLMDCLHLKNKWDQDLLKDTMDELTGLQDLFSIKINLNLDFNILRNIQDCIRLKGFALDFDLKGLLCGLVKYAVNGDSGALENYSPDKLWNKMKKRFMGVDENAALVAKFKAGAKAAKQSVNK